MGINVQLQTEFRDGESQTYSVDFVVPEPWQTAHPDSWVLAGCPASETRSGERSINAECDVSQPLCSRKKSNTSFRATHFVDPTEDRDRRKLDQSLLEENRLILDPFFSSSFKDLNDLEQCHSFRVASAAVVSSPPRLKSEVVPIGGSKKWTQRISRGLMKASVAGCSSQAQEEDEGEDELSAKSCHRNYVAYLGKHRKVLTPRCDPSLLGRMERAKAVILLQRCLRGRAAQMSMVETKSRVLHLYPELNEFGDKVDKSSKDTTMSATEELNGVKQLVGDHLYELFLSVQTM